MIPPPLPENEEQRLQALVAYQILDTPLEADFDQLVQLAANICDAPIALISLIDRDRQWFKASCGLDLVEADRSTSMCGHAILQPEVFVIENCLEDLRFFDNPFVIGKDRVRFYAGAPLVNQAGLALGTICVLDRQPRTLTAAQLQGLKALANQVVSLLELRLNSRRLQQVIIEKDKLLGIISHDLRAPFHGILALAEVLAQNPELLSRSEMEGIAQDIFAAAEPAYRLVENLRQWSLVETQAIKFCPDWFKLSDLVAEVFTLLSTFAKLKKVKLVNDCTAELEIYADRDQLGCVLQNLVTNSIKFCLSQGKVSIRAIASSAQVEILVQDNGVGISDLQMEVIQANQQFYSSKGTLGEPGTGIGMNLCRQLIAQHQGELLISSEVGRGTEVRLVLPQPINHII
ncbi:MAG: GAF domain-containing sensor histidine kinase [Pseudanabaenaceae cyanobacterium bins.68]|nr:GAF domain-containing sensor histidine kinase [Pseudanabaenaceae cyanobacterium bins.68]